MAVSSEGDDLFAVCAPHVVGSIDAGLSTVTYHPKYSAGHPLFHLSEKIRSLGNIHLRGDIVKDYDLFYVSEYPVFLVVSQRLVDLLTDYNVTGIGVAMLPELK